MTFLVWRLSRMQWAIALALLAAFAAVELIDGFHMAHAWHSLVTACAGVPASPDAPPCLDRNIVSVIGNDLRVLSVMVPAILGLLWGAPLIAHEMETGTAGFAWTQGVTRTRWLAARAGAALLAAAIWAGAISALVTWWSGPENAQRADAFTGPYFDTQGIAPIGYALFAMALGIAAGTLLRRTIPAIAVTLGGFIGVRALFDALIRPHLMPAVTTVTSMSSTWAPPGIAWRISSGTIGPAGQVMSGAGPFGILNSSGTMSGAVPVPSACRGLVSTAGPKPAAGPGAVHALAPCLSRAGFRQFVTYQPGGRYWDFQGIETGIYALAAAVLLAASWYAVRHRDA